MFAKAYKFCNSNAERQAKQLSLEITSKFLRDNHSPNAGFTVRSIQELKGCKNTKFWEEGDSIHLEDHAAGFAIVKKTHRTLNYKTAVSPKTCAIPMQSCHQMTEDTEFLQYFKCRETLTWRWKWGETDQTDSELLKRGGHKHISETVSNRALNIKVKVHSKLM